MMRLLGLVSRLEESGGRMKPVRSDSVLTLHAGGTNVFP